MGETKIENISEEGGDSTGKAERIRKIPQLIEAGIGGDNVVLYGTSPAIFDRCVKEGVIPRPATYFYGKKSLFPDHPLAHEFIPEGEGVDRIGGATETYAELAGQRHYFLEALGMDINNEQFDAVAGDITVNYSSADELPGTDEFKFFRKRRKTEEQIKQAFEGARRRKGIILALDVEMLKKYPIEPGDKEEGDLKVVAPGGLPFECIHGIKAMGQEEEEYLQKLIKE